MATKLQRRNMRKERKREEEEKKERSRERKASKMNHWVSSLAPPSVEREDEKALHGRRKGDANRAADCSNDNHLRQWQP
ncbi:hypothetical protein DEO72_LG10g2032 [Vigna unguiculata]|uniref:Uncharacterized protein n=1 Tax=Vigna unguiculata TaxID=3917 RepID=A0A4D6NA89_VIGUN|nr:hypothetical protein DEO72_LG10g2032 [Vigna unguiculata]